MPKPANGQAATGKSSRICAGNIIKVPSVNSGTAKPGEKDQFLTTSTISTSKTSIEPGWIPVPGGGYIP